MLIKCKFLKDGKPSGRDYTYRTPEAVKIGDMVQINDSAKGVVTMVDVAEEEVAAFADRIKMIIGKTEPKMVLKNWSVFSKPKYGYMPPELQTKYLQGNVYGHPDFEDGRNINTSPIDEIMDRGDHKEIITRTGSRYLVYPQDVDPDAENEYPRYYERLQIIGSVKPVDTGESEE